MGIVVVLVVLGVLLFFWYYNENKGVGVVKENKNNVSFVDISSLVGDDPVKGNENAPVTIIEFSDFQCPFCGKFFRQTYHQLEEKYIKTGKVKLVYKDFPLSFHKYAEKAAEAANCAYEQGKFWEYHDLLFANQDEWGNVGESKFIEYAQQLGLDMNKFRSCLNESKYKNEIIQDYNLGVRLGVKGTPTFIINGVVIVGAQPYPVFENVIEQALVAAGNK